MRLVSGGDPAYKSTEPSATAVAGQTVETYIANQWPDSRYKDHGDGTVTDTTTGLMWKQCPEGQSGASCAVDSTQEFNWKKALEQAQSVNASGGFAGYSDWRVPNIKELGSLIALDRGNPTINTNMFPSTPTSSIGFWSSSHYALFNSHAWYVGFNYGGDAYNSRSKTNRLRLVRDAQ